MEQIRVIPEPSLENIFIAIAKQKNMTPKELAGYFWFSEGLATIILDTYKNEDHN